MKLRMPLSRRDALKLGSQYVGVGSLLVLQNILTGCKAADSLLSDSGATDSVTDSTTSVGGGVCSSSIPSETAGPYPAHDDSAINCLRLNGIVRSDIRSSLNTGGYSGSATATGIPLKMNFTVTDKSTCSPIAGYAFYLWHCDISGKYSMYSSGVTTQTYLRGVQTTDSSGQLSFTTIFPGCYDGRMPHMHFEIFPSLSQAVDNNYSLKTSQLTFPMDVLNTVYATSAYSTSKTNLAKISYATDNVFSDGYSSQLVSISGNTTSGYIASLVVGI